MRKTMFLALLFILLCVGEASIINLSVEPQPNGLSTLLPQNIPINIPNGNVAFLRIIVGGCTNHVPACCDPLEDPSCCDPAVDPPC